MDGDSRRAERRQVSVLFADMVGSTELSLAIDPEDLMTVLGTYQRVCGEVVSAHGGTVVKYLGDGVMAAFGYPVTREGEVLRAVRCGLALIAALDGALPSVQVRVGVHTGVVVVVPSHGGSDAVDLIGDVTNIAARIQGLAEPGTVVISDATLVLVAGAVDSVDLGLRDVRGAPDPIRVHRVDGARRWPRRLDAISAAPAGALVGRDAELARLRTGWSRAVDGAGSLVCVAGAAGIGKTRLVAALLDEVEATGGATALRARCAPHTANTPLGPIIDLTETTVLRSSDPQVRRRRFVTFVERLDVDVDEAVAVCAPLYGFAERADASSDTEEVLERLLDVMARLLLALAADAPVVLVVEDLHWADRATIRWLSQLAAQVVDRGVLVLTTARPEFDWPDDADRVDHIDLAELGGGDAARLSRAVAGDKQLPLGLARNVLLRAAGVPLFVEELTRWAVRQPVGAVDQPLPPTLHELLVARLDAAGDARRVAQVAAVVAAGDRFAVADVVAVAEMPPGEVEAQLDALIDANVMTRAAADAEGARTSFRHALFRDAAYGLMLKADRRLVHRRMADLLDQRGDHVLPELLGAHRLGAEQYAAAVDHFRRAAEAARARGAFADAAAHLRRAIDVVQRASELGAGDEAELQLQLGFVIGSHLGYMAQEAEAALTAALECGAALDDATIRRRALSGLNATYMARGDLRRVLVVSEQLVAEAERAGDRLLRIKALYDHGTARVLTGDLEVAAGSLRTAVNLQRPEDEAVRVDVTDDPAADAAMLAMALAWLGEFDESDRVRGQAERTAARIDRPATDALVFGVVGTIDLVRHDVPGATATAARLLEVTERFGIPFWDLFGRHYRGWGRAHGGDPADGLDVLGAAFAELQAIGIGSMRPFFASRLGELLVTAGRRDEAVVVIDDAFALVERSGEAMAASELHRVRGLARGDVGEIANGLDVALAQRARPFALRAALDLDRLARDPDERARARAVLRDLVEWFDEHGSWVLADQARERLT